LADMQAGPVVPTGTTLEGRDYAAETVKYLTFMTYSGAQDFDLAIDGITIALKDGRSVVVSLEGEASTPRVVRAEVSLSELLTAYPPSFGSSYGVATTDDAYGGEGVSLRYVKTAGTSPANEKFELHLPFTMEEGAVVPASAWDEVRAQLGAF